MQFTLWVKAFLQNNYIIYTSHLISGRHCQNTRIIIFCRLFVDCMYGLDIVWEFDKPWRLFQSQLSQLGLNKTPYVFSSTMIKDAYVFRGHKCYYVFTPYISNFLIHRFWVTTFFLQSACPYFHTKSETHISANIPPQFLFQGNFIVLSMLEEKKSLFIILLHKLHAGIILDLLKGD